MSSLSPQQEVRSRVAVQADPDPMIRLMVLDQQGKRAFHTMRMSDKLQAVMDAYYTTATPDVKHGDGSFYFDGALLRGCKTPADFEMEDGDRIDFFRQQLGGGGRDCA
ncbi:hypothetical protein BS78_02G324400 [Paspalum vaginatum]|nr:hypothetical protein BS78_02G324400 [Paspalum vaginatum]